MNLLLKRNTVEERTVHAMIVVLCVLAIIYCIVLLVLIFSVIEKKQNTIATRGLSSEVSNLETRYAEIISSINDTSLFSHGFIRIDEGATFAIRKDEIASYTVLYAR